MKTLLVKATLTKMGRLKDGSVNVNFNTMEEIDSEEFKLMDQYFRQDGWLAFKMNELDGSELPERNATAEGTQRPSQKLRASLFALHMAKGGTKDTFEAYYNRQMAAIKRQVDSNYPESK